MLSDASHRLWVTKSNSDRAVLFSIEDALYQLFGVR